jgi:holo-[acyl-carrier protein] synthase
VIIGLGTDIVEIERIASMIDRHGAAFLERVFTAAERDYCGSKKHAAQHYAGRWAAKEAAMKALGTGFITGIHWHDFEVLPQKSGAPKLTLSGGAAEHAKSLGIDEMLVTMSHCKSYATATAIGVRKA